MKTVYRIYLLSIIFGFLNFDSALPQSSVELNNPLQQNLEVTAESVVKLSPGFFTNGYNFHAYIARKPFGNLVNISNTKNYLKVITPSSPIFDSGMLLQKEGNPEIARTRILYFDGLQRLKQEIDVRSTANFANTYSFYEYDRFGRRTKDFLPFPKLSDDVGLVIDVKNEQTAFFINPLLKGFNGVTPNSSPLSEISYEQSIQGRSLENSLPAARWSLAQQTKHTVRNSYTMISGFNYPGSIDQSKIVLYQANFQNAESNQLVRQYTGNESASQQLVKIKVQSQKNLNWVASDGLINTVEIFFDKSDRKIASRMFFKSSDGSVHAATTYFVYNSSGQLCFVLPPDSNADVGQLTADALDKTCYQYVYDDKGRVIKSKEPGVPPVFNVYNKRNEIVLIQDGNLFRDKQWLFNKYDVSGRLIQKGIYSYVNVSENTRGALQALVDSESVPYETRANNEYGYTAARFPQSGIEVNEVNYFDTYNVNSDGTSLYGDFIPYSVHANQKTNQADKNVLGLLTYSKHRVLGTSNFLGSLNFYDSDGYIIQRQKKTILNKVDIYNFAYDFKGNLIEFEREHVKPNNSKLHILQSNTYDHNSRLILQKIRINDGSEIIKSKYIYNDLGQLITKSDNSIDNGLSFSHVTSYQYNDLGLLISTSSPLMSSQIRYEQPTKGAKAQYDGTVSEYEYTVSGGESRYFTYIYDDLHRLKQAQYSRANELSESVDYDIMGNILSMSRGPSNNKTNYLYASGGHRLTSTTGVLAGSYEYDPNGNMTFDGRKNLRTSYNNYTNLPNTYSGSLAIDYSYSANGEKVGLTIGNDNYVYVDGVNYLNGTLDFVDLSDCRLTPVADLYNIEYFIKDYLGNCRMSFSANPDQSPRLLQEAEYFPFGLRVIRNDFSSGNNRLFNGKELQVGTGEYDFHSRFYDPQLARWKGFDAKAAMMPEHSPYNFSYNNPVNFVDPDGMMPEGWVKPNNGGDAYWDAYANSQQDLDTRGINGTFIGDNGFDRDGTKLSHVSLPEIQINGHRKSPGERITYSIEHGIDPFSGDGGMENKLWYEGQRSYRLAVAKAPDLSLAIVNTASYAMIVGEVYGLGRIAYTGGAAIYRMGLPGIARSFASSSAKIAAREADIVVEKLSLEAAKGGANTLTRSESVLGHIFREAPGHVNPSTLTSQGRYIKLFENVGNNSANINPNVLTNFQRATEGFQGFSQIFRNGKQIWVQTFNGKIINAGVNVIPK